MKTDASVLSIDAASGACGCAIVQGEDVLFAKSRLMRRGQAEFLAPLIREGLHDAQMTMAQINRIAVTVGPGSFAGIRVGVSTARALSLKDDGRLPVVGLSTLQALALQANVTQPAGATVAAVDIRRGYLAIQVFDAQKQPLGPPRAATVQDAARYCQTLAMPLLVTGDGGLALIDALASLGAAAELLSGEIEIDPVVIARHAQTAPIPDHPPAPLYLRPPDAKPQRPPLINANRL